MMNVNTECGEAQLDKLSSLDSTGSVGGRWSRNSGARLTPWREAEGQESNVVNDLKTIDSAFVT